LIRPPRFIGFDQFAALRAASIGPTINPRRAACKVEAAMPASFSAPNSAAKPPSCHRHDDDQDREAGDEVFHLL
jgi:hypothetical protein